MHKHIERPLSSHLDASDDRAGGISVLHPIPGGVLMRPFQARDLVQ